MRKIIIMAFVIQTCMLLFGCAGQGIPATFIKPLVNKKIALELKRYQDTKCLENCLVDKVDECYCDIDDFPEGNCKETEKKCVKKCPIEYKGFKCIDLYPDEKGIRKVRYIKPWAWQNYFDHLTVYTFVSQNIAVLKQIDFICNHDFIICKNHYEVIKGLDEYVVHLEENK